MMSDLPDWAEDRLITDITVSLDWRDRLRLLLVGTFHIQNHVTVEFHPGHNETETTFRMGHLCWPWHRHMEMGVMETQPVEGPA